MLGGKRSLNRSPLSRLPDRILRYGLTAISAAILVPPTSSSSSRLNRSSYSGRIRCLRLRLHEQLGCLERDLRRPAAAGRHADHLGAGAGDRSAYCGLGRAVPHRALPAADSRLIDDPGRPAGRGALGRLRPLGLLLPDPEAETGRAVVRRHLPLHPLCRDRQRRRAQLLHRWPRPGDHAAADRQRDQPRGSLRLCPPIRRRRHLPLAPRAGR